MNNLTRAAEGPGTENRLLDGKIDVRLYDDPRTRGRRADASLHTSFEMESGPQPRRSIFEVEDGAEQAPERVALGDFAAKRMTGIRHDMIYAAGVFISWPIVFLIMGSLSCLVPVQLPLDAFQAWFTVEVAIYYYTYKYLRERGCPSLQSIFGWIFYASTFFFFPIVFYFCINTVLSRVAVEGIPDPDPIWNPRQDFSKPHSQVYSVSLGSSRKCLLATCAYLVVRSSLFFALIFHRYCKRNTSPKKPMEIVFLVAWVWGCLAAGSVFWLILTDMLSYSNKASVSLCVYSFVTTHVLGISLLNLMKYMGLRLFRKRTVFAI